jgi:hypothetical protein
MTKARFVVHPVTALVACDARGRGGHGCRICAPAGPVLVEEFGVQQREPAPRLDQPHVVDEHIIAVNS